MEKPITWKRKKESSGFEILVCSLICNVSVTTQFFLYKVTFMGSEKVEVGVHAGVDQGVKHYFLHHFNYFPAPYHTGGRDHQLKSLVLFAKASLELLCQTGLLPSLYVSSFKCYKNTDSEFSIVTNDWVCGLLAAYVRVGAYGNTFNGTTFFHLVHNLEEAYQGRIILDGPDDMSYIHNLPRDLLVDPLWSQPCINACTFTLLCGN
jgi:starch synthase